MKLRTFPLLIILNSISSVVFSDTNSALEIPTVTVSNDLYSPIQLTYPNTTIITQQTIQQSAAQNIPQLLYNQAGIQLQDIYGDNSNVAVGIRGFSSNAASNSLLVVNGFRLVNPDLAIPDLNSIPVQDIERIEIIPGSASVLYGDQAVGGVVNIITRQPEHFIADLSAGYGSYSENLYNILLGDAFSNGFNYLIDGSINNTDNYRDHNNQNLTNMISQVGYDYSSGSVFLNYQNFVNKLLYAGALTATQVAADPRQAEADSGFDREITNNYQLGNTQEINSDWSLQTGISHQQTTGSGIVFTPFSEDRLIETFSPRLLGNINNNLITTGVDLQNDDFDFINSTLNNTASEQQHSIYGQIVSPINHIISAIFGLRYANQDSNLNNTGVKTEDNNNAFVSEEALNFQLNPEWQLFIRREGNYRFPKADENGLLPMGVTGLKTQTGTSYETGFNFQKLSEIINLTIYHLEINNEIAFNPLQTPTQPFGANTNLPPTTRNGAILSVTYPVTGALDLTGVYSYVNAYFNQTGNDIPFVAENTASVRLNYDFLDYYNFYIEDAYTGDRFALDNNANVNGTVGAFMVCNAVLQYQHKAWSVSARMNNIFNKKYNALTIYNPSDMTDAFYPAPGRNFLVTLNYQIG